MSDPTYNTKVYMDKGGNRLVVAAGGVITIDGGQLQASEQLAAFIGQVTDSTGGTAGNTIADVGASYNQATLNNNFASLASKVNQLEAVIRALGMTASA